MTASSDSSRRNGDPGRTGGPGGPGGTGGSGGEYSVFTPERVSLQYEVAGIGSRAAAAMVDSAIQWTIYTLLTIVLMTGITTAAAQLEAVVDTGPWLGVALIIFVILGLFFLLWGYYMIFEIVWNGQTPGKRMLGLRVMRENGYPIRPSDSVVRNLVRVIDGPPFGFVIGVIAMLLNERARRLGDFAAGTIVIREAARQRLEQLPGMAVVDGPTGPSGSEGAGGALAMEAEEATLVRDFLLRRHLMDGDARRALAERMASHLSRRYGLAAQRAGDDEAFLEWVVAGG